MHADENSAELPGKDQSLWVGTTEQTSYPPLQEDDHTWDVVVVGGGITGVVTAFDLRAQGLDVVLIERGRIVEWTTGGTTAKLSSQHYLAYDYLTKRHGAETAQAFADANQHGIERVASLSEEHGIDCDFSRRSAYVYSADPARRADFEAEVAAATALGLPASIEHELDLPFAVDSAVRFAEQAQFHPRKFLLGLAERFTGAGGVIHEQTNALEIEPGEVNVVRTEHGDLRARHVVQASGEPFWRNELFEGRMWLKMSYALGVRLKGEEYPQQMYLTTDRPMRTLRSAPYAGGQLLIFGGESHEYDEATYDEALHYRNLVEDVQQKFDVEEVVFRWLAGDFMPFDRIPFIGPLPEQPNVHVITGYRAWGLAWALSASEAVTAEILGHPLDWAAPFGLQRLSTPLDESEKIHGI